MNGETVESGTFEVGYIIRAFEIEGEGIVYDYITNTESDETYETIEEARNAAERSLSY